MRRFNLKYMSVICDISSQLYPCCSPAAGGTENGEDDSKKATEEELSFIKSSICEQWKKFGVRIHKKKQTAWECNFCV